jgi:hypothetical protein
MSDGGSRQEAGLYRSPYNGAMDNTQGESACQALERKEGRDSTKYSDQRGCGAGTLQSMHERGCIGERCRGSTKYTTRTE